MCEGFGSGTMILWGPATCAIMLTFTCSQQNMSLYWGFSTGDLCTMCLFMWIIPISKFIVHVCTVQDNLTWDNDFAAHYCGELIKPGKYDSSLWGKTNEYLQEKGRTHNNVYSKIVQVSKLIFQSSIKVNNDPFHDFCYHYEKRL